MHQHLNSYTEHNNTTLLEQTNLQKYSSIYTNNQLQKLRALPCKHIHIQLIPYMYM